MLHTLRLDGANGFIEKSAAQVPVVVRLCGLLSSCRVLRTNHGRDSSDLVLTVSTLDVILMLTVFT